MSAPLPTMLRAQFQEYIEEGLSGRAAAARLQISPATGSRWSRAIQTKGHINPAPLGRPAGQGKLAPYQAFVEERVAQNPNITLYELRDALMKAEGIRVHHSSISALLSRLGFTYKKNHWRQPSAGRKSKTGAARRAMAPHADYAASN